MCVCVYVCLCADYLRSGLGGIGFVSALPIVRQCIRQAAATGVAVDSIHFAHMLLKEAVLVKSTHLRFEGSRLTDSDLGTVAAKLFRAFVAFVGRLVAVCARVL